MSLYVLDTDILSLLQDRHPAVVSNVSRHHPSHLTISIISVEEQLSGWYTRLRRAKTPDEIARAYQRLGDCVRTLSRLTILMFSVPAIHRYKQLQKLVRNVRKMDLRIAAIALEHNATVVTRNRSDFQRIPGLLIEDWSQ